MTGARLLRLTPRGERPVNTLRAPTARGRVDEGRGVTNEHPEQPIEDENVVHVDFDHGNDSITVTGSSTEEVMGLLEHGGLTAQSHGARTPDWATYELSEQEAEIIRLIATGISNDEVAGRMYLSINTIKSYVRAAYRKMGVESRTQAVLWAVEHGLVHPGEDDQGD
jgi:DNA-binding CsgD family transcriptional regulator